MRRSLIALLIGVTLASCGGDDPAGLNGPTMYGTYQLQSIGGESPPWLRSAGMYEGLYVETEIVGGTWTLNDDDTWNATQELRITVYGALGAKLDEDVVTDPVGAGSYVKTDSDLLFKSSSGQSYSGSISGPVLTVMLHGNLPAVYRK